MTIELARQLASFFGLSGTAPLHFDRLGSGHIHHTYFVEAGNESRIIQRVNKKVFVEPQQLQNNLVKIEKHCKKKEAYFQERNMTYLQLAGGEYFESEGYLWRAFHEVKHSYAMDVPKTENHAFEGAKGFACFAKAMTDMHPESLHDSIPQFHNGQHRLNQYMIILRKADKKYSDRFLEAKKEILSLTLKVPLIKKMYHAVSLHLLPNRIAHNDTKINNILFDQNTNKAHCVIDLDTVMAGTWLYDFGDMVRTFTSTAKEDEPDPENIHVDEAKLKAVKEGFLSELSDQMTEAEKVLMPLSAQYMCTLIGMRFLTDFLQGDTYFPVSYPEHNLIRARNQFLLADELQKYYPNTM